jgi:hypothetical protein
MNILAVDPGQGGGFAWVSYQANTTDKTIYGLQKMPSTTKDIITYLTQLRSIGIEDAVIEDVPKFAGKNIPSSTTAVLFYNVGVIEGTLQTLGFSVVRIAPAVWQKFFRLGTRRACASTTEWKNKLKAEAQRRYPELEITLATADALLLLDYYQALKSAVQLHSLQPS